MIVELSDTTTSAIAAKLSWLKAQGGASTLGRVFTLLIVTTNGFESEAIAAAIEASRERPARIIVLVDSGREAPDRLDAQIRAGAQCGASEIVVLHGYGELAQENESLIAALILPEVPIVAWWPQGAPANASETPIGRIAHRRITDSASSPDPHAALSRLADHYEPGDTDLAWTRLTKWRVQLAAALDHAGSEAISSIRVKGAIDSPSTFLLAAWLGNVFTTQVTISLQEPGTGIRGVQLCRTSGRIELFRRGRAEAELSQPGRPCQRISLPRRSLQDCLGEELRRLGADHVFGETMSSFGGAKQQNGAPDLVVYTSKSYLAYGSKQALTRI